MLGLSVWSGWDWDPGQLGRLTCWRAAVGTGLGGQAGGHKPDWPSAATVTIRLLSAQPFSTAPWDFHTRHRPPRGQAVHLYGETRAPAVTLPL